MDFKLKEVDTLSVISFSFPQRLSNGSIDSTDETSQIVELQELLEKQNYEMAQMKERFSRSFLPERERWNRKLRQQERISLKQKR